MQSELRQQYDQLYQEISDLHFTWAHYRALFGKDAARVDLLMACSPNFFSLVERELWNSMLLRLTRITAEVRSGYKASTQTNLTVRSLPRLVNVSVKGTVKAAVNRAIESVAFAVEARHKYLAHLALDLALDRENAPFKLGSRQQIETALAALVAVLDQVTGYYDGTSHSFDFDADSQALVSALEMRRVL